MLRRVIPPQLYERYAVIGSFRIASEILSNANCLAILFLAE